MRQIHAAVESHFRYSMESASELYLKGIQFFQKGEADQALLKLELAVEKDPQFADAYEVMGVILGRQKKYEQAIDLMDQLLIADPKSILAHTNKSLYYMNLGKIEEAEEEKGLATLAGFSRFDNE